MLHRPFYVKYNEWTSYGAAGEKICATDVVCDGSDVK